MSLSMHQCVQVDWEGKKALITAAKAMGIQRYIFYSIVDCDKSPDVALMNIKRCTELYLEQVCVCVCVCVLVCSPTS